MPILSILQKKYLVAFVFISILTMGVFLRSYHFSHWLHFEIDQSYDTLLVSPAVEGSIASLPLLGPTAGGGRSLRLGPAFYYLEYLSAKFFGNTPPGHAALVLIFSIFSLPLFYIFCRRYFSSFLSLCLLLIFSTSLYMVMYSRFSWSPNVLPFLLLLSFYSLLRSVDANEKKPTRWFFLSLTTIAITMQIHFNAFFTLPAIVGVFLLWKRPRFNWKTWLLALILILSCFSSVILSDIKQHGQNFQYFIEKLSLGSNHHTKLTEKLAQAVVYNASEYFLIVTGQDHVNGKKLTQYGLDTEKEVPFRIGAIFLLVIELSFLLYRLFTTPPSREKDFLVLICLWFLFPALYFFSIARSGYNIYPRFFLLVSPLAIIFLGLLFKEFIFKKRWWEYATVLFMTVILVMSNSYGIVKAFNQWSHIMIEPIKVETEDVFPNTARITLAQQEAITDYIETKQKENNFPVYLEAKHEYISVFWYHLEKKGIFFHEIASTKRIYQEGNYFFITFSRTNISKKLERFSLLDRQDFGALTVYFATAKPETITAIRQETAIIPTIQTTQIRDLYTWQKLFAGKTPANEELTSQDEQDINSETIDTTNPDEQNPSDGPTIDDLE